MKDAEKREQRNSAIELDIISLLKTLLSKAWLMAIVGVLCAGLAFLGAKLFITPKYRCEFTVYVNNQHAQTNKDTLSSSDLLASKQLTQTYAQIIRSNTILMAAVKSIDADLTYRQARAMTAVEIQDETEILSVYVIDSDPVFAYDLATALSKTAPQYMASIVEGSSMKVIDYPEPNPGRYSPSYLRYSIVGLLFGVLIIVIKETIGFFTNDTITDENTLETQFDLPILGIIPDAHEIGAASGYYKNYSDYEYKRSDKEGSDGN